MKRNYPKKQDHGTRGMKWSTHTFQWGNVRKGMCLSYRYNYRKAKHRFKVELKKISIECSDEEVEKGLEESAEKYGMKKEDFEKPSDLYELRMESKK